MFSIKYSNQAILDLKEAIRHISIDSEQNALDYLLRYEKKIELLSMNPLMGTECKNKSIKRDCRVLVHESHILIYEINKNRNEILIIRIYHSSVDYLNRIKK